MIAIINYRAGNLKSVETAIQHLGYDSVVTDKPEEILAADRVIFPGVGAAGEAMRNLNELQLKDALGNFIKTGRPFLGICLGYQVLFEHSKEDGGVDCLGFFPGNVIRFPEAMKDADGKILKIPQMGWNSAEFPVDHPVTRDIPEGSEFYFVHSYHPAPHEEHVCAVTEYGIKFGSGVARDNMIAFQFHPEKSGRPGLKLLDNFCKWQP